MDFIGLYPGSGRSAGFPAQVKVSPRAITDILEPSGYVADLPR